MGDEKRAVCCRREHKNVANAEAAKEDESAKATENPGGLEESRGKGGTQDPRTESI